MKAFWRRPGAPVLVVHIMKTAGTSFRHILQDDLGMRAVYPSDADLQRLPNGWYRSTPDVVAHQRSFPRHRVLIGHFPASIVDVLDRPYATAVFLRDPVQRALSAIYHLARDRQVAVDDLVRDEEFVGQYLRDFQTKVMGMEIGEPTSTACPAGDELLRQALIRLDGFDFVGLTEDFDASCRLFDARFGTATARRPVRDNVGRQSAEEGSHLVDLVRPLVERDEVLYAAARRLFDERCGQSSPSRSTSA